MYAMYARVYVGMHVYVYMSIDVDIVEGVNVIYLMYAYMHEVCIY